MFRARAEGKSHSNDMSSICQDKFQSMSDPFKTFKQSYFIIPFPVDEPGGHIPLSYF